MKSYLISSTEKIRGVGFVAFLLNKKKCQVNNHDVLHIPLRLGISSFVIDFYLLFIHLLIFHALQELDSVAGIGRMIL